jgi:hypothetical protein
MVLKNIVAKQQIELEFKTKLLKLPADLPTECRLAEKINSISSNGRGDIYSQIKPHGHKVGFVIFILRSPQ